MISKDELLKWTEGKNIEFKKKHLLKSPSRFGKHIPPLQIAMVGW